MIFIAIALSAVVGIVLLILGVKYLLDLDFTLSAFVYSNLLILLFGLVTYFVLGPFPLAGVPSLASIPFGYFVRLLILSAGLPPIIANPVGFLINFLAFLGLIRWIQKKAEKKID